MAKSKVRVSPYWELRFDADGDPDPRARDRLLREVRERGVRDLVVFAHGWNNDHEIATSLYDRFLAPFPSLAPGARLGYVGVLWPAIRFTDEHIPDFPGLTATGGDPGRLDAGTRRALTDAFPGSGGVVAELARLLEEQPDSTTALDEFAALARLLTGAHPGVRDGDEEPVPPRDLALHHEDTAAVCRAFAAALREAEAARAAETGAGAAETGAGAAGAEGLRLPGGVGRLWAGAHELLRQATYFTMKRRAGRIGKEGLGPLLGLLAERAPDVRVHLVGHSFGARLVSFALAGLPDGARNVKSAVLLQGAFSHYAFAPRLPRPLRGAGALNGRQGRIDGPLVACYSRHDTALGVMYPLASRLANDDAGAVDLGARWGALGCDGVQEVEGARRLALADVLRTGVPTSGCVSVDASQVVREGPPPSGAHSDICHPELARLVVGAGRIT